MLRCIIFKKYGSFFRFYAIGMSLLSLAVLSACSMIPEYRRPAPAVSDIWNNTPGYQTQTVTKDAVPMPWQDFYRSPQLQHMIKVALKNNNDLRTAVLNIESARASYGIQRSDLFPNFGANSGATLQRSTDESSVTGFSQHSEVYSVGLNLSRYEIDVFGRIKSLKDSALQQFLATLAARDIVRNSLIAELSNAYLQLLADQKLLALTKKTLAAQNKTLFLLTRTKQVGIATTQDVARAQTAVETAKVNMHQYQRFIMQDKNALVLLMGVGSNTISLDQDYTDNKIINDQLMIGLPSEVLLRRPDVRQAEYLLKARNADIGAARAAFFPNIQISGDFGFASQSLRSLLNSSAFPAWTFVPQISLPIFTAGRNQATLDLAIIRKDQAVINYEQTIKVAFREVSDELAAKATFSEQLKAQRRLVNAAQRVYDTSEARYRYGVDNFLSVLDAQRELYIYQQNEIQIHRQLLSNLVELYKSLGGGSSSSYPHIDELDPQTLQAKEETTSG